MITFIGLALIIVGMAMYILKKYNDWSREKNYTLQRKRFIT
jgi:hypothetical protein